MEHLATAGYTDGESLFMKLCLEEFWNASQIWRSANPSFGRCVERSILVWVPCGFLWLCAPLYITFLKRRPLIPTPHTSLGYIKVIVSVLLIMLSASDLLWALMAGSSPVPPVDFISPIILIITFALHIILVMMGHKRGVPNNGLLWLFWLFVLVCGLPQLYTVVSSIIYLDAKYSAIMVSTFLVQYMSCIVMFVTHCFSDAVQGAYKLDNSKNPSPELWASYPSSLTFNWCSGLVWTGWHRPLTHADLWDMLPQDTAAANAALWASTVACWRNEQPNTSCHYRSHLRHSSFEDVNENEIPLLKIIFKAFHVPFFVTSITVMLAESSRFLSPYVLGLLIQFINDEDQPVWIGYFYAAILFGSAEFFSFMRNLAFRRFFILNMRVNASVMAAVYRKAMRLSASARREFTLGDIVNLMAVDAHRLGGASQVLTQMWGIPVIFILSFTSLWQRLGPAVLAGIGMLLFLIPVNATIVSKLKKLQADQMKYKDKRVKLISEIISGIKVLKFYAWEESFAQQVEDVRKQEIKMLKQGALLQSISAFIWNTTPYMIAMTTFMTYLLISVENVLDVETAFVSIVLFNIMRLPINQLPNLIAQLIQASVAVKRLQKFISVQELDPTSVGSDPTESNTAVTVKGEFSWDTDSEAGNWKLRNINLEVENGQLVAVVGSVGAGKSSLLSALLGEMKQETGYVCINGRVAYVSQQAWLQNASIRDNITWGLPYEEHRYQQVVEACALQQDIDILPAADMTEIGENGINLSGGQKQRVALARAAYSNPDVVLLDDPLSAVDAHVGRHIFDHVVGPQGILRHQTRVLVTHSVTFLPRVDQIIVLSNGQMVEKGSFSELMVQGNAFATFLLQHTKEDSAESLDEAGDDSNGLQKPSGEPQVHIPLLPQSSSMKDEHLSARKQEHASNICHITEDCFQHISGSDTSTDKISSLGQDSINNTREFSIKHPQETVKLLQDSPDSEYTKLGHPTKTCISTEKIHVNGNNNYNIGGNVDENITVEENKVCEKISLPLKKTPFALFESIQHIRQTGVHNHTTVEIVDDKEENKKYQTNDGLLNNLDKETNMRMMQGNIVQQENAQTGKVSRTVYIAYGKAMGVIYAILPIICIGSAQGSQGGGNIWLSQWATSAGTNATLESSGKTTFLAVYSAFGVAQAFFFFVGMLLVMLGCLKAAKVLHKQLLESVIHFPMSFFDTNPSGRIINRFSKEIDILDNVLPGATRATINTFSSVWHTFKSI